MSIPPKVNALIERLYSELEQLEHETTAELSFVMLFAETLRRRIDYSGTLLTTGIATEELIREIAEDLLEQLGRVLEAKIAVNGIRTRLNMGYDSEST